MEDMNIEEDNKNKEPEKSLKKVFWFMMKIVNKLYSDSLELSLLHPRD